MTQNEMTPLEYCRNNPVKAQNIPDLLKEIPRWLVWKSFKEKPDGRFDKIPICPSTGYNVSGTDQTNHMTFEVALQAHQSGSGDGIGIALTSEALCFNDGGKLQYLIGVDLDKVKGCSEKNKAARSILKTINSYSEVSPSGTGIRIFALSDELVGKGQSPSGEIYNTGRFLTVTGHGPQREVVNATDQLKALECQWWPEELSKPSNYSLSRRSKPSYPDTLRKRAELDVILSFISADCDYDRYRDVVWAILSVNWRDAEEIARNWCLTALDRFEEQNFKQIVGSFNPRHDAPVTPGSLVYWARKAGWNG
jgi:hypothetical protein